MASLHDLLNTARDALAAQSFGLNVAGQNVANVNTDGYVRRSADLETRVHDGASYGSINVAGLHRIADIYAERRLYTATGLSFAAEERNTNLSVVEALFNDFSGSGIGANIDSLFASFSELSANPNEPTTRSTVLQRAEEFAQRARETARELEVFRQDMYDKARSLARQVNEQSAEVASLNQRIQVAEATGSDAADLKDRRDSLLSGLSEIIDIRTFTTESGQPVVQGAGTTLIEGNSYRDLSVDLDTNGNIRILASRSNGAATNITSLLGGGSLGGLVETRDVDVPAVNTQLDQLVFDIATAINTQHAAGFGLDGVTGRDLFQISATAAGAARSLALNPIMAGQPDFIAAAASAAGLPAGADNALLLGQLSSGTIAGGGARTASQAYSDLIGDVGSRKAEAARSADTRMAIRDQVSAFRESVSGVSLDEEMISLTKFQRAYEAASKVLSTADQLLAELLRMVD